MRVTSAVFSRITRSSDSFVRVGVLYRRDMGTGLDNWEQVAEMRAACRELTFGDEQGRENEVWLDYNADLVSFGTGTFVVHARLRAFAVARSSDASRSSYLEPDAQLAWEEEQRRRRAESQKNMVAGMPAMVSTTIAHFHFLSVT